MVRRRDNHILQQDENDFFETRRPRQHTIDVYQPGEEEGEECFGQQNPFVYANGVAPRRIRPGFYKNYHGVAIKTPPSSNTEYGWKHICMYFCLCNPCFGPCIYCAVVCLFIVLSSLFYVIKGFFE